MIYTIGSRFLGSLSGAIVGLVYGAFTGCKYHYKREYGYALPLAMLWGLVTGGVQFLFKGMYKGGSAGLDAGILYYQDVYLYYYQNVNKLQEHRDKVASEIYPDQKDFHGLLEVQDFRYFKDYVNSIKSEKERKQWQEKIKLYRKYAIRAVSKYGDPITIIDSDKNERVRSRKEYLEELDRTIAEDSLSSEDFAAPSFTLGFPRAVLDFIREAKQWLSTNKAKKQPAENQPDQKRETKPKLTAGETWTKSSSDSAAAAWAASSGQGPAWDSNPSASGFGLFQEHSAEAKDQAQSLTSRVGGCWGGDAEQQWSDESAAKDKDKTQSLSGSSLGGCYRY